MNILAIVTAGFAKEVEEVNQYPAVINKATAVATSFGLYFLTNKIVVNKPNVATISLINNFSLPRKFEDICINCRK